MTAPVETKPRRWFRRQSDGAICLMGYPIRIEQKAVQTHADVPFLIVAEGRQPGQGAYSFELAKAAALVYADEIDALAALPLIDDDTPEPGAP